MFLDYNGKKSESQILNTSSCLLTPEWNDVKNKLIFGDNLKTLKSMLDVYNLKEKIDLVYIDPPFATNKSFTIGEDRVSTISNSQTDNIAYHDTLTGAPFLEFIRERLILLRELMSNKASIYLHIDYKIGHYIKIIMDEVFGVDNFKNNISRIKCNPKNFKRKAYGNQQDVILFYSKSKNNTWNEPKDDFTQEELVSRFSKINKDKRRYTTIPLHAPGETLNGATGKEWRGMLPPKGRHWRSAPDVLEALEQSGLIEWSKNGVPRKIKFADKAGGKKKQDFWEYKDAQYPIYPTEKNLDMLETIVSASSNQGDVVLDCFCGSGTTMQAAEKLGRSWIGIDKSKEAINVTKKRLSKIEKDLFSESVDFQYLEEIPHNK